jgi:hypothetical protein
MFNIGLKQCEKCGFRHGYGRCCIDIYQRLGHQKGPSMMCQILLAFVLPVLVFIGGLVLADYILSFFMNRGSLRTFFVFAAALLLTLIFVQLIRIFTRRPIDINKLNK